MARITVEDCIDKFSSRFELVLVASNRARKLHSGESPTVERDNDKNTVIALREIAQETIAADKLKNDLVEEYQTTTFYEDEELVENEEEQNSNDPENSNILDNSIQENDQNIESNSDFSAEESIDNEIQQESSETSQDSAEDIEPNQVLEEDKEI